MEDRKIISNKWPDLVHVAKRFSVPVSEVVRAKEQCKTNIRKKIYAYLEEQKVKNLTDDNGQVAGKLRQLVITNRRAEEKGIWPFRKREMITTTHRLLIKEGVSMAGDQTTSWFDGDVELSVLHDKYI